MADAPDRKTTQGRDLEPPSNADTIRPPTRSALIAEPYFTPRSKLDDYSALAPARLGASKLIAAYFRRDRPDLGLTVPNERSETLMAVVNLRPQSGNEIWREGRHGHRAPMGRGGLAVLDHREAWSTLIAEPFETVHIFFDVADFERGNTVRDWGPISGLDCSIDRVRSDDTMLHLALALLPAIERPDQVNTLFADHMYEAIRQHLAVTYGGLPPAHEHFRGRLSPHQKRLVNDILFNDLAADVSLVDLARACGVSTRQFSRAFKETHSIAPHRWLLQRRVERAQQLLEHTSAPISEIALECGFADQSHLTRVFHAMVGTTPAAWRRLRM